MHVDGFSEGEKPELGGGSGSNSGAGTPSPTPPGGGEGDGDGDETVRMRRGDGPVPVPAAGERQQPEPETLRAPEPSYDPTPQASYELHTPDRDILTSPSPGPSNSGGPSYRRRRSRSRSRSRTSKDLKRAQAQGLLPRFGTGDSSADEAPPTPARALSPFLLHPLPVSPTPRFLPGGGLNTTNLSSNFPFNAPSPSLSGPSSPVIGGGGMLPMARPTLSDIQAGLKRSNSAGRSLAMRALTGGTEDYTPSPSPTHGIGRNNTVSGGERSAARKMLLNRLGTRIGAVSPGPGTALGTGGETSGGEEVGGGSGRGGEIPAWGKRGRKRRSRGGSRGQPGEFPNNISSNAAGEESEPGRELVDDLSRSGVDESTTRSQSRGGGYGDADSPVLPPSIPLPQLHSHSHSPSPVPALNSAPQPQYPRRRSVFIEDDYEYDEAQIPPGGSTSQQQSQRPSPVPQLQPQHPSTPLRNSPHPHPHSQPSHLQQFQSRLPHSSDAPSDADDTGSYPVYLSGTDHTHAPGGLGSRFPSSPFGTPMREPFGTPVKDDEDGDGEEEVLYPPANTGYLGGNGYTTNGRPRAPLDAYGREISWVADIGTSPHSLAFYHAYTNSRPLQSPTSACQLTMKTAKKRRNSSVLRTCITGTIPMRNYRLRSSRGRGTMRRRTIMITLRTTSILLRTSTLPQTSTPLPTSTRPMTSSLSTLRATSSVRTPAARSQKKDTTKKSLSSPNPRRAIRRRVYRPHHRIRSRFILRRRRIRRL